MPEKGTCSKCFLYKVYSLLKHTYLFVTVQFKCSTNILLNIVKNWVVTNMHTFQIREIMNIRKN